MAHRLIIQPNGRYAVYSTNNGQIILWNCTRGELIELYAREEGAKSRVRTAEWLHASRPESKHHTVEEAVSWFTDRSENEQAEEVREMLTKPVNDDITVECKSKLYRVAHWIRQDMLPDLALSLMYPYRDEAGAHFAELTAEQVVRLMEHFDVMLKAGKPGFLDGHNLLWLDDKGGRFRQR
jgi:hypothetical protein